MNVNRRWVTPLAAGAFTLSAVTGVLMFFHADSGLNREAHEWLGWVLLGGVVLHVLSNFPAFKGHLWSSRGQLIMGAFVIVLLLSFIPFGEKEGGGKRGPAASVSALANASLTTVALVAKTTPEELRSRLEKAGLHPASNDQTISDLVGKDFGDQMHVLNSVLQAP